MCAAFQGLHEALACRASLRVMAPGRQIALVGRTAQHAACKQAGIAFECNTRAIRARFMQTGQRYACMQKSWSARMQHQHNRRVDPFHGRAAAGGKVRVPMRELGARWAGIAPGFAVRDQFRAAECRQTACELGPGCHRFDGPAQAIAYKCARQAKRKVEGADPVAAGDQPVLPVRQCVKTEQCMQTQHACVIRLECLMRIGCVWHIGSGVRGCMPSRRNACTGVGVVFALRRHHLPDGHRDRLAPRGRAREIDADQAGHQTGQGSIRTGRLYRPCPRLHQPYRAGAGCGSC